MVALRVQNAFSFEVYVIDEGIASLWCFCKAFKLLLHVSSVDRRRFGQHLRQSSLQSGNKKFRLEIDCVGQKAPQLVHLCCVLRLQKLRTRVPWTRLSTSDAEKNCR